MLKITIFLKVRLKSTKIHENQYNHTIHMKEGVSYNELLLNLKLTEETQFLTIPSSINSQESFQKENQMSFVLITLILLVYVLGEQAWTSSLYQMYMHVLCIQSIINLWLLFDFHFSFISGFMSPCVSCENHLGIAYALTFWREFYLCAAVLVCKTVLL